MNIRKFKSSLVLLLTVSMSLQSVGTAQACQLTDWLFGRNQNNAQPVVTNYTPLAANYVANYPVTSYPTRTVSYRAPVVTYVPQTTYRTVYRQMPVTVYRPNVTVMSPSGLPVTNYQGCRTTRTRVQRYPYTTRQPQYSCPSACDQPSVVGSACNGYQYAPATAAPATGPQPRTWVPSGTTTTPMSSVPSATSPSAVAPSLNTQPRINPVPSTLSPLPATPAPSRFGPPPTGVQPAPSRFNPGPAANSGNTAPTLNNNSGASITTPMKTIVPTGNTDRVQVIRPDYTAPAPAAKPEAPKAIRSTIKPIPDPEVYPDLIKAEEAPQLFNPKDKTAMRTAPEVRRFDWVSVKSLAVKPATYKQAVPKPRFDDSGWVSSAR